MFSKIPVMVRFAAVFTSSALIMQFMFVLFFTPAGVEEIYSRSVELFSEKVDISNNSYAEYYNMNELLKSKKLIVVGINEGVSQNWSVIFDYLKYSKQHTNVSTIILEIGVLESLSVNRCLASQNVDQLNYELDILKNDTNFSDEFVKLVESIYNLNTIMPPNKKVEIRGVGVDSSDKLACAYIGKFLQDKYANLPSETKYYVKTARIFELYELLTSQAEIFKITLDDVYYKIMQYCTNYVNYNKNSFIDDSIMYEGYRNILLSLKPDNSCLGVVSRSRNMKNVSYLFNSLPSVIGMNMYKNQEIMSSFRDKLSYYSSLKIGQMLFINILYSNSHAKLFNGNTIYDEKYDDIVFKFSGKESHIKFMDTTRIESVLEYYDFIANPFRVNLKQAEAQKLRRFATQSYFVIVNGTPCTY